MKACVFTNYTGDSAPVEQIGNFFTAESIHDCMWHCYNAGECVFLRYRSLNVSLFFRKRILENPCLALKNSPGLVDFLYVSPLRVSPLEGLKQRWCTIIHDLPVAVVQRKLP